MRVSTFLPAAVSLASKSDRYPPTGLLTIGAEQISSTTAPNHFPHNIKQFCMSGADTQDPIYLYLNKLLPTCDTPCHTHIQLHTVCKGFAIINTSAHLVHSQFARIVQIGMQDQEPFYCLPILQL